ncbi:MAG: esterase-like activity of phytase family protein [Microcoleaceae cyanobacterium]
MKLRLIQPLLHVIIIFLLSACSLPQVSAETRMFLDMSLNFLGAAELPAGHLSGVTYQIPGYTTTTASGTYFYGVSEQNDPTQGVSFYQLKLDLDNFSANSAEFSLTQEAVTPLKDQSGQLFDSETLKLESIAFSPRNSVFIAAEEVQDGRNIPLIGEFDLQTGQLKNTVPLPPMYRPTEDVEQPETGIETNQGFRSLTIAPDGFSKGGVEPFRLFATTSAPLFQDLDADATELRVLHYVIADRASFLISEKLYSLESNSQTDSPYRLADIIALPQSGHFLSLEQSHTSPGNPSKIYQIFTGSATDISRIASLRQPTSNVEPLRKKLLLDLDNLGFALQHIEGMTLGPRLSTGEQSLILITNNPDDSASATQFLLFELNYSHPKTAET